MKTKIIAEIASSHNGDLALARAMIRGARDAGADIVKFQSWQASRVPESDPDKKRYEKLELPDAWHGPLQQYCEELGAEFLTAVFNKERIPFLKSLGLKKIKIPSPRLSDTVLIEACAEHFDEIIISTGMARPGEVEHAIEILKRSKKSFTIMHCVSLYPCPPEKANLGRIDWLKTLAPDIGYSDHTLGTQAAVIAMSKGITYLEKHFTLSRHLPQDTHSTGWGKPTTTHENAAEPHELREIAMWRDAIAEYTTESRSDAFPEELAVREKYINRL